MVIWPKKNIQWFKLYPSLSSIKIWKKSNFRPLPRNLEFDWFLPTVLLKTWYRLSVSGDDRKAGGRRAESGREREKVSFSLPYPVRRWSRSLPARVSPQSFPLTESLELVMQNSTIRLHCDREPVSGSDTIRVGEITFPKINTLIQVNRDDSQRGECHEMPRFRIQCRNSYHRSEN